MHVGAVHGRVAAGTPAIAQAQSRRMIFVPDIDNATAGPRHYADGLRVALETEVVVPLNEHLGIDGAVRVVANGTPLAQRLVFVDEWPGLLAVAGSAGFIQTRHGQAARRLANIHPMWIVALHAIHLPFEHRMVLRKIELGMGLQMASETRRRISTGIDDEFAATTPRSHMFAAGTVARFTAR